MNPKVSVVMSVYNGSSYLQEAVNSILNQTFTDFEFIIIDDGSTDSSYSILCQFLDKRIKVIKNDKNIGLTKSLNKGLSIAQGKYIARMDADDISLPERLEKQVNVLDCSPDIVLVSCNIEIFWNNGMSSEIIRSCESYFVKWYLLFYNHLGGHGQVLYRKNEMLSLGGYCEDYRYSQDYQLWSTLSGIGNIFIINEFLYKQRRHEESISTKKNLEQLSYVVKTSKENIYKLTQIKFEDQIIKDMTNFMVGIWLSSSFFEISDLADLDKSVRITYLRFIENNSLSKSQVKKLKQSIGVRYWQWFQVTSTKKSLAQKILIAKTAMFWNLSGTLPNGIIFVANFMKRQKQGLLDSSK